MKSFHYLLITFALLFTFSSCSKDDDIVAVVCEPSCGANGICNDGTCVCLTGYEGETCGIEANEKFLGVYNTNYTGSGGLAGSGGNTTMTITKGDNASKIQIAVPLELGATLPQIGSVDLPINLTIQADVDGNSYSISSTTIGFSVPVGGFNLPIDITFQGTGNLSGSTLNSTWTFTGLLLNGTLSMVGN